MVRRTFLSVRRALVAGFLALGGVALIGVGPAAAVAVPNTFGISPSPALTVFTNTNSQAASNETFVLPNDFSAGNTVVFIVSPNGTSSNNCTTHASVAFGSTPTVAASTGSGGETAPTITATLGTNGADTSCSGVNDVLTLTLPNGASGTNTDTFTVTVSNITYSVGSAAATGLVNLTWSSNVGGTTATTAAAPNANVLIKGGATATANNPAVLVTEGTSGGLPSSVVVTESSAGAITGSICISVAPSSVPFTFASAGSTSASVGNGVIAAPTSPSATELQAVITTPSTSATTYTFSGFTVDDGPTTGPAVVTVSSGAAACATPETTSVSNGLTLFSSAPALNTTIAGSDTDGTAIAELEKAYPAPGGCPTSKTVILATDQNFPDALAASYLAGHLGTGILLTPTASLSTETQKAMQTEGITTVDVVGGPLAVSQNTINQVNATPAFNCGGTVATGGNITVSSVIAGQDQYGTAEQIATTPGSGTVGTFKLSAAYNGAYNDTTGAESSAPSASGALRTAIVASGTNFPDATAASIIAYRNQFPILLTDPASLSTDAATGLQALGIQQALVLGGPLAVSDADVASIQALGISVIRIAGQDQTDTAAEMADFELNQSATFAGLGWGATTGSSQWGRQVLLARGDFYADALAGSVLGTLGATPILLTENPTTVGQYLTGFLNTGGSAAGIDGLNSVANYNGNIQSIQPLGGPLALQFGTLAAAVAAVAAG